MGIKFANNASSVIPLALSSTAVSFTVTEGDGALFPALGAGDFCVLTIEDPAGNRELVRATERDGDLITVIRAQEGTIAIPFPPNSRVENRVTAGTLEIVLGS